ncbi:hypothetical protein PCANC_20997 [Puccinia coronata f. sp. avenae]|uniref:PQ-loop repeat-containing protein n=1 Tax=Puccinia coronata f. sp. avenae TaxID=200324 RepID=A0A2N5U427_9BASI|nr:hypothetical protein PCASD_14632 [Puccinia coronata f. sp. avenae]PLW33243.1 hypothetical protein PCANC_20997 [Puccinia coronata f. sp. avenae]
MLALPRQVFRSLGPRQARIHFPTSTRNAMLLSALFGNLSQVFWLFAQLPQIWTNYRNKSVEGLSLPFLLNWLSGDVTNLIGCLLTNQLLFQRNLAIYFNLIDLILIAQFALYSRRTAQPTHYQYPPISESHLQPALSNPTSDLQSHTSSNNKLAPHLSSNTNQSRSDQPSKGLSTQTIHPPPHSSLQSKQSNNWNENSPIHRRNSSTRSRSFNPKPFLFVALFAFISYQVYTRQPAFFLRVHESTGPLIHSSTHHDHSPSSYEIDYRTHDIHVESTSVRQTGDIANHLDEVKLDATNKPEKKHSIKQTIGRLSAWLCAFLYLTSRIPQIMKNYTRKSVEGLSILLFILAFLGNLTYVLSILTSPHILLTNPRHHRLNYLNESVPYLIGSAGTLCFDFTIFVQSAIYRRPPTTCSNIPRTLSSITCTHIITPSTPLASPSTFSHSSGSPSHCGNCSTCPLLSSRPSPSYS